jgi:hypothetical protein
MLCAGLPTALQNKKQNKAAKGVTAEEFRDFMILLEGRTTALLQDPVLAARWNQRTGGTPAQSPPIYSFDNPRIHIDLAVLLQLGMAEMDRDGKVLVTAKRLVLPPYSGDLHRCIERLHARICGKFQDWVNKTTAAYSMFGYCQMLQHIFYTTETHDITYKDIQSIDALYQKVIELDGAKAPRPFC